MGLVERVVAASATVSGVVSAFRMSAEVWFRHSVRSKIGFKVSVHIPFCKSFGELTAHKATNFKAKSTAISAE